MTNINHSLVGNPLNSLLYKYKIENSKASSKHLHKLELLQMNTFNSQNRKGLNYHSDVPYSVEWMNESQDKNFGSTVIFILKNEQCILPEYIWLRFDMSAWATDATTEEYLEGGSFSFVDYIDVQFQNEKITTMRQRSNIDMFYQLRGEDFRNIISNITYCGTLQATRQGLAFTANHRLYHPIFAGSWLEDLNFTGLGQEENTGYNVLSLADKELRFQIKLENVANVFRANGGLNTPQNSLDNLFLFWKKVNFHSYHMKEFQLLHNISVKRLTHVETTEKHEVGNGATTANIDLSNLNSSAYALICSFSTQVNIDTNRNYVDLEDISHITKIELLSSGNILDEIYYPYEMNLITKANELGFDSSSRNLIFIPFGRRYKENLAGISNSGLRNFHKSSNMRLKITSTGFPSAQYCNITTFSYSFFSYEEGQPNLIK